jgi:hypothetical protein
MQITVTPNGLPAAGAEGFAAGLTEAFSAINNIWFQPIIKREKPPGNTRDGFLLFRGISFS